MQAKYKALVTKPPEFLLRSGACIFMAPKMKNGEITMQIERRFGRVWVLDVGYHVRGKDAMGVENFDDS